MSEKPEQDSDASTGLEEALRYANRIVELTRKHYDPNSSDNKNEFKTQITLLIIQIIQGYGPGPFRKIVISPPSARTAS
jgi:hypothetical protein